MRPGKLQRRHLTAAGAAILGLSSGNGQILQDRWWVGIVGMLLGAANMGILSAHHLGNRFHTKLAGKIRRRLEGMCEWNGGQTATDLRNEALREMQLDGPDVSIGGRVFAHLRLCRREFRPQLQVRSDIELGIE